jgi:transcriptional regulator with XRE-family HTH domain
MGRGARPKPNRLAEKLLRIRNGLRVSQNELINRLGLSGQVVREEISDFERGVREPPLAVLLKYARAANVYADAIIDDDLDLPDHLPANPKSEGVPVGRGRSAAGL